MESAISQFRWAIRFRVQTNNSKLLSDQQLVAAALDGEAEAYGELVRRHQTAVYNVAYHLVGNQQDALDLAQEAFVRAYRALVSFDHSRPFRPWINRIVTNLAINWLKQRRALTLPLEGQPIELPDASNDPERAFLASERQAAVRRAILALPPHYRAVIELRHLQDLSYEEIASALAIPLSDVKSHLFRARQLLRQWLEENR